MTDDARTVADDARTVADDERTVADDERPRDQDGAMQSDVVPLPASRTGDSTDLDGSSRDSTDAPTGEVARSGLTRRRALQVLAAGAAGAAALPASGCTTDAQPGSAPAVGSGAGAAAPPTGGNPLAAGTPTDPDLVSPVVPWDPVLEDGELETLAALCDAILPADDRSPAASALGAHHFIDEWVGAPYEGNRRDLVLIRGGVAWLELESADRFGAGFADLADEQKTAICDDIRYEPNAGPEYRAGARFFDRVRDLTLTAFWTTREGMDDLGFVGNRAMASFDGPPPEVLRRLGLDAG